MEKISLITYLHIPEFGITLLIFTLILMCAPYLSGADFGVFIIPKFDPKTTKKLKFFGPIAFSIALFVHVPILSDPTPVETTSPQTPTVTSFPKSSSPADTPTTSNSNLDQIPDWELKVEPELPCTTGVTCRVFVTLRSWSGSLIVGETVYLEIVDGPHAGLTIELETNERGQGAFSYVGEKEGTDVIRVWAGVGSFEEAPKGMSAEVTLTWKLS